MDKWIFGLSRKGIFRSIWGIILLTVFHFLLGGDGFNGGILSYGFWIYCSLIAVFYGTLEGLFASCLSILFYSIVQLQEGIIPQELMEGVEWLSYPFFLLFSAIVFGEYHAYFYGQLVTVRDKLHEMTIDYDRIIEELEDSKKKHMLLKNNWVNSQQKLDELIGVLSTLIQMKPTQILLNLENTVQIILGAEKFSIYGAGLGGLEVIISHGWLGSENIPLRIVREDPLYASVMLHHETLTGIYADQAKILGSHGILAIPLVESDSNEAFGMLKIEKVESRPFDIHFLEIAQSLGQFIGKLYTLSKRYQESLKNGIYSKPGGIYSEALYRCLYGYLLSLAKEFDFCLFSFHIVLRIDSENIFFTELKVLSETIQKVFPPTHLLFQGKSVSNELIILLPGKSPREVELLETQFIHALQDPASLPASKVYLTRKIEYLPHRPGNQF